MKTVYRHNASWEWASAGLQGVYLLMERRHREDATVVGELFDYFYRTADAAIQTYEIMCRRGQLQSAVKVSRN
jgi:hypothetical protein